MRFLITGGAGFIGSHLADALLLRGHSVTLLDDLSTGSEDNVARLLSGECDGRVRFQQGSVLDGEQVGALVQRCDVIVHLAATVGVHLVLADPIAAMVNNIHGTEVVVEAALRYGKKLLLSSTSEIYGKNGAGALHEDSDSVLGNPFKPRWAYSTSKAVDEIIAHEYWRRHGLPTIVARLFNCSGSRQTGAYGMVIPRFVRQALAGEDLTVYGDGTQARCFCHVLDTVEALVGLLECEEAVGDVFNVGSHNETSIRALAELVVEMTGSSSKIRYVPYEEAYEPGFEDMERRLPDISKIGRLIGWRPSRSLPDIVSDVIAYELDRAVAAPRR